MPSCGVIENLQPGQETLCYSEAMSIWSGCFNSSTHSGNLFLWVM